MLKPESAERDKNLAALDEIEAIIATFLDYARAANASEERSRSDLSALVESLYDDLADTGADLCRKHGISEWTFYNWKSKYGGMMVSEAKR